MIYIVIPVFNRWVYTQKCILSLISQTYSDYKIVVVDHGSTDGTSANISNQFPDVILLKGNESMWWAEATNLGVLYGLENGADYILTLNNDLIVNKKYLSHLIEAARSNPMSIIGSVSTNIKDQESVAYAGTKWIVWQAKYRSPIVKKTTYSELKVKYNLIESDLLPGRGTLFPSSVFTDIGFFDHLAFPHYMADEVFSLKARKNGFRLYVAVKAVVFSHVESTGLNSGFKRKGIFYLYDSFTSIRSPNKLSVRWNFAQNTRVPFAYFTIDFIRTFCSQVLKTLKEL